MDRFRVLSKSSVKSICMLTMFLNHAAYWFLPPGTPLHTFCVYIGWVTAPCMCWFLAQGFAYTRDRRKYGMRLLIFTLISQWPFMFYFNDFSRVNMIGTLFICYLGLCVRHSRLDAAMRLFLQATLFVLTVACDWPLMAFVMVVLLDWSRSKGVTDSGHGCYDWAMFVIIVLLVGLYDFPAPGVPTWHVVYSMAGPAVAAVLIMVFLDTSKRSSGGGLTPGKYFFYWFYPAHLVVLGLIHAVFV